MVRIDMDVPRECHECPLQLRFKDGVADEWYNRRCVIKQRTIEYPKPNWCPLIEESPLEAKWELVQSELFRFETYSCSYCHHRETNYLKLPNFCSNCGARMKKEDEQDGT